MDKEKVSAAVKEALKQQGKDVPWLAWKIGLQPNLVYSYLKNSVTFSEKQAQRMLTAVGLTCRIETIIEPLPIT